MRLTGPNAIQLSLDCFAVARNDGGSRYLLTDPNANIPSWTGPAGARREPKTAKSPLSNMPMRQGAIAGHRPADFCRLLLLRELPRGRKPLRAIAFRAARPQSRRGNRLPPLSKGSHSMRERARVSSGAPAQARIRDPAGVGHMLQFGDVRRLTKGHWLTLYRNRSPAAAPPVEMRVMTKDRRNGVALADDLPNYDGYSGKSMLKLIAAWIAMGFRRPEILLGKTVPKAH